VHTLSLLSGDESATGQLAMSVEVENGSVATRAGSASTSWRVNEDKVAQMAAAQFRQSALVGPSGVAATGPTRARSQVRTIPAPRKARGDPEFQISSASPLHPDKVRD